MTPPNPLQPFKDPPQYQEEYRNGYTPDFTDLDSEWGPRVVAPETPYVAAVGRKILGFLDTRFDPETAAHIKRQLEAAYAAEDDGYCFIDEIEATAECKRYPSGETTFVFDPVYARVLFAKSINRMNSNVKLPEYDLGGDWMRSYHSDEWPVFHRYPSVQDWNLYKVIHRNTLEPRSNFFLYRNEADAIERNVDNALVQCLSGTWKFQLSKSPYAGPQRFYEQGFNPSAFTDIQVPGMWQLQGHGKGPHYTNVQYPWPVNPPEVPYDDNECGRYITTFKVDESFSDHQLRLRFEGVDAAFHVWVNGEAVGYSQGSRNPSEFDVTRFIDMKGDNTLAVAVYQRCDGSYLEDQDQWWLSGIFRDVYLHAFPKVHPTDFHITTELDDEYKDATLKIKVDLSLPSQVHATLINAEGGVVGSSEQYAHKCTTLKINVKEAHKWTAESPYLYTLTLTFGDGECSLAHRVGFRTMGLIDGVFCVNGHPIKFRGVNRHEHDPDHGRAVPYSMLRHDLLLMKKHNINAIRTCHQPNDVRLYELADELGLWVLDEADLECHGFNETGGDPASFTSDNPRWQKQYVDRAKQLVARDKNFTCVIMWSLGNEAFYGQNHQAMYDCIKEMDQTRLVHYEADHEAKTADIYSMMYPSIDTIVNDYAKQKEWEKPLVLCEYLHAMGNSCGNAKEYMDAFYKYPRLMGGFVWEWANHGLRTKTKDGEEFMGYGGDFGDVPNDGNFVMDGMIFSDHSPSSNLVEYGKAIEPVQVVELKGNMVEIVNRYDTIGLEHLDCTWQIVTEKGIVGRGDLVIPEGIKPHTSATLTIEDFKTDQIDPSHGEAYLKVSFSLRSNTNWAKAGHVVAFGEFPTSQTPSIKQLSTPSEASSFTATKTDDGHLSVSSASGDSVFRFDLLKGTLVSWTKDNEELLSLPIDMDFYRALTDNDRAGHGRNWIDRRLHETSCHAQGVVWKESKGGLLEVKVRSRIAPPVLCWAVDVVFTYRFSKNSVTLRVQGKPHGLLLPETFARIGITFGLRNADAAQWWGRGPGDSYRDRKLSQSFGTWKSTVDDLWVDYEYPQDGGNRTDVRHVTFLDASGKKLIRANFGDLDGASFSAMRYTTKDIDECTHPYELRKRRRRDAIVRLDWAHHGMGGASCGPWTLEEYQLKADREFDFEIVLDSE